MDSTTEAPAYGLWPLVAINAAVFIIFAFSFFHPQTRRDWRTFGAFSAFVIALFTEMYGFPLTIYLLSGWLESRFPGVDLFSHDAGHLPEVLLGWKGDPHLSPLHILSYFFIFGGFVLLSSAWRVLYKAQQAGLLADWNVPGAPMGSRVATGGPYAHVRHPQYVAFVLILIGFLLQWPTLLTLFMFPILVAMYVRLARREEREMLAQFGDEYTEYMATIPAFMPRFDGGFQTSGHNHAEP
jgi:protein-S-isoprenylcysteine O-methyltransferase Ste14